MSSKGSENESESESENEREEEEQQRKNCPPHPKVCLFLIEPQMSYISCVSDPALKSVKIIVALS